MIPIPESCSEPRKKLLRKINSCLLERENGCLEWSGAKSSPGGYGIVWWEGKNYYIHRIVYCTLHDLPFDFPFEVMHKCDNPPCANPIHLTHGTQGDNKRDSMKKGRYRANAGRNYREGHFRCGHPFTTDNIYNTKGRVVCKTCTKVSKLKYYARIKAEREKTSEV